MEKSFPTKIREQREKMGLTKEALGHLVGIQASYIERIERGTKIPKPSVARRLAQALQQDEESYVNWAKTRSDNEHKPPQRTPTYPRYPEAREALIGLSEDPEEARQLFSSTSMGPLEAALYGLLIDRMSAQMGDLGFWGFMPKESPAHTPNGRLLLDAFFEMLTHPEGEIADYTKVFSGMIKAWRYLPPHRIVVMTPDDNEIIYRLALVDKQGSIIPALEPEDPFYALYRMLTTQQQRDIADICNVLLRSDERLEIQAALVALSRWHHRD